MPIRVDEAALIVSALPLSRVIEDWNGLHSLQYYAKKRCGVGLSVLYLVPATVGFQPRHHTYSVLFRVQSFPCPLSSWHRKPAEISPEPSLRRLPDRADNLPAPPR